MDRSNVGAVGQWGVPHCERCGSAMGFWGPVSFDCVSGDILVWMCRKCPTPAGVWELVTDGGYPVAAYAISEWSFGDTVWEWLRAGWRK
jgi:hypothetical protein